MSANYFPETNRLPLLLLVPSDGWDGSLTLGASIFAGGRSGKRSEMDASARLSETPASDE